MCSYSGPGCVEPRQEVEGLDCTMAVLSISQDFLSDFLHSLLLRIPLSSHRPHPHLAPLWKERKTLFALQIQSTGHLLSGLSGTLPKNVIVVNHT